MLFALLLGLHRDSPVAIVQFLFGLLCFAVVFLFGRRLGGAFTGAIAIVLLMAFGLVQNEFFSEMCMAYIDIGLTAFTLLATFTFYLGYRESNATEAVVLEENVAVRQWLLLAALFAGLATTVKLTGVWVIVSLLFLMLLLLWRKRGMKCLPFLLRFGGIASLVAAPWFVKTWLLTGNPFYPMLFRIFGGIEWTSEGLSKFTHGNMIWNTPPGMQPTPQVLLYSHLFNAVMGSLICLLTIWRTRRSPVAIPARMAATFTACICITTFFHTRFIMPIAPLALLGIAFMLRDRERSLALPAGILALFFAFPLSTRYAPPIPTAFRVATGITSRTEYMRAEMPDYAVTEAANRLVPREARILIGTYANNLAYYDAEALWPEWWLQDSIHYETRDRLETDLRRLGVNYLVLDPEFPDWCERSHSCRERKEREPVALTELAKQRGEKLFEANGHTLYRLHWDQEPHPTPLLRKERE
jgi:hypothetical protein